MARPVATDFLHNMRFHVVVVPPAAGSAIDWMGTQGNTRNVSATPAGFMSVSAPDVQVTAAMYKEGTMVYERKYPGEPSMGGDLTMDRGVARGDSSFWHWIRTVIEGSGEYRADLDIKHYHREQSLTRPLSDGGDQPNKTSLFLDNPARIYHVHECFPTAHNVVTNALTATDGEISIMSITVAYEHFEVQEMPA